MSSGVACSSLEFVRHKFDLFLHENISHVKEFIHLIDPIKKGFDIKIFTERRDVNLYPVLMKIWASFFPTMIRVKESSLPIRVKKPASPIWIRISKSLWSSVD